MSPPMPPQVQSAQQVDGRPLVLPTLAEVLDLPVFRSAAPEVLAGEPERRPVRWVHSSEVYEMGGLLTSGELLLTTGLGLEGRGEAQLASYIERLADAGCAGIAFEVGRSFVTVPEVLVETARRRGMCFVLLGQVVPFVSLVEGFHDLVMDRRAGLARGGDRVWGELLAVVAAELGLVPVLNTVARLARSSIRLLDPDGAVVAESTVHYGVDRGSGDLSFLVDVVRGGELVGRLEAGGGATASRRVVLDRGAVAVGLELAREGDVPSEVSPGQRLVTDLVAGALVGAEDVLTRCAAAGLPVQSARHVAVAAFAMDSRLPHAKARSTVREAVQRHLGACVLGSVGELVVVLVRGSDEPETAELRRRFIPVLDDLSRQESAGVARFVVVGRPVVRAEELGAGVVEVRDLADVARRAGVRGRVVTPRDLVAERFLTENATPAQLAAFVTETLGPVFDHDARTGSELVRTLGVLLAHGMSRGAAAQVLGVRRQTVYARATRIEQLLDVDLSDPSTAATLGMSFLARRLRTGQPGF